MESIMRYQRFVTLATTGTPSVVQFAATTRAESYSFGCTRDLRAYRADRADRNDLRSDRLDVSYDRPNVRRDIHNLRCDRMHLHHDRCELSVDRHGHRA